MTEGKVIIVTAPAAELGHGSMHPLCTSRGGAEPWEFAPDVFAWTVDGNVVLQGEDGDVTIPRDRLALLARALLAAHVTNGRLRFEERS